MRKHLISRVLNVIPRVLQITGVENIVNLADINLIRYPIFKSSNYIAYE